MKLEQEIRKIRSEFPYTMKSFLVNAGGTGTGAAVNGTVDVNLIGGSTKARITDARINNASANKSNVNVIAHDYANSAGGVGRRRLELGQLL